MQARAWKYLIPVVVKIHAFVNWFRRREIYRNHFCCNKTFRNYIWNDMSEGCHDRRNTNRADGEEGEMQGGLAPSNSHTFTTKDITLLPRTWTLVHGKGSDIKAFTGVQKSPYSVFPCPLNLYFITQPARNQFRWNFRIQFRRRIVHPESTISKFHFLPSAMRCMKSYRRWRKYNIGNCGPQ